MNVYPREMLQPFEDFMGVSAKNISCWIRKIIIPAFAVVAIFYCIAAYLIIPVYKNLMAQDQAAHMRVVLDSIICMIEAHYNLVENAIISEEQAQMKIIEKLHDTYNINKHFYVEITDGHQQKQLALLIDKDATYYTVSGEFQPWGWQIAVTHARDNFSRHFEQIRQRAVIFLGMLFVAVILLKLHSIRHSSKTEKLLFDAEKSLYESERLFEAIFDNIIDGVLILNMETHQLVMCNKSFAGMLGYSTNDIAGLTISDIHPADCLVSVIDNYNQQWNRKSSVAQNVPVQNRNADVLYVDINASPIFLNKQKCLIAIYRDISSRIEREKQLQFRIEFDKLICTMSTMLMDTTAESLDSEITNSLKAIGWFLQVDRAYIFLADETTGMIDKTHEWCTQGVPSNIDAMRNIDPQQTFPWFYRQIANETVVHVGDISHLPFEAHLERQIFKRDGIQSLICVPLSSMSRVFGFLGFDTFHCPKTWEDDTISLLRIVGEIFSNALARKKTALALKKSEERYRFLVNNINLGIVLADADENILMVNDMMCELFNKPLETFIGKKCYDVFERRSDICPNCPKDEIQRTGQSQIIENEIVTDDGTRHDMRIKYYPIFNDTNEVSGYIKVIEDITATKKAEEQLQLFKKFADTSVQGFGMASLDFKLNYANQALMAMLGEPIPERVIGKKVFCYYDDDMQKVIEHTAIPAVMEQGHWIGELTIKSVNNRYIQTLNSIFLINDSCGKPLYFANVVTDITERKKMEEELTKTRKLESVGILAGGIAHDFNNLLTAILGNISLAMLDVSADSPVTNSLKNAEKASLQARELSQQLLTFSRGGAPIRKTTSIEDLIRDSANFSLKGSNVKCEFVYTERLLAVEVDKGQISQVINNLVINAQQAMKNGGTITIAGKNATIAANNSRNIKPGRYIHISIKDEGCGISEENVSKIFDPYFTTKEKGSGLGLATSYSIIKKHDGYIFVDSVEGSGTTFHIYLPASKKQAKQHSSSQHQVSQNDKPHTGKGRILVMDDEEMIRQIVGRLLEHLGYTTCFAVDGQEAIRMYEQALNEGVPYDAVIMDLTIPGGMGGKEAINLLRDIDPDIRAVVSSGYSNDPVMANYRDYGFSGIARKPFDIREISAVLHDVITG